MDLTIVRENQINNRYHQEVTTYVLAQVHVVLLRLLLGHWLLGLRALLVLEILNKVVQRA